MSHPDQYTKEYFIEKFEAIPADQWCIGKYTNLHKGVIQHCALGHCGLDYPLGRHLIQAPEAHALYELLDGDVILINDGGVGFKGKTPKQRILNALKAIQ